MTETNQMFSNETIFKTIQEMVKQYEDKPYQEDEYREKCIDLVYNTFNVDKYQAEILFDLAMFNEWIYLTDTDTEIEFDIQMSHDWDHFECRLHNDLHNWRDYRISYNFPWNVPVLRILKSLEVIAKAMEKLDDDCTEQEELRKFLPLI